MISHLSVTGVSLAVAKEGIWLTGVEMDDHVVTGAGAPCHLDAHLSHPWPHMSHGCQGGYHFVVYYAGHQHQ